MAAPPGDRLGQRMQRMDDRRAIRIPPPPFALVEPIARCSMPALAVASSAGGKLVLDPARTALDPRDQVFGRRLDEADLQRSSAPDARRTVAFEDDRHPFAAIELTH